MMMTVKCGWAANLATPGDPEERRQCSGETRWSSRHVGVGLPSPSQVGKWQVAFLENRAVLAFIPTRSFFLPHDFNVVEKKIVECVFPSLKAVLETKTAGSVGGAESP